MSTSMNDNGDMLWGCATMPRMNALIIYDILLYTRS